jgi:hypothetical protein
VEANPLATGHASPNAMVKALPEEINLAIMNGFNCMQQRRTCNHLNPHPAFANRQ